MMLVIFHVRFNNRMDFVKQCVLLGENCNARALLGQYPLREELLLLITFPFLVTTVMEPRSPEMFLTYF